MKKTISANIAGVLFQIDEDAYVKLEEYFYRIESGYQNKADAKEIVNDLESRMAELLEERIGKQSRIVTIDDVNWAISKLGRPEDIGANPSGSSSGHESKYYYTSRRLYRDPDNRVLGGVCSGIGAYFDIDPVIIRVIFVVSLFIGFGPLLYIILWIVVPAAYTPAQKREMHGRSSDF